MTAMPDPRGGLYVDLGDGHGPVHWDDLTPDARAAHLLGTGLAALAAPAPVPPAPPAEEAVTDHAES